MRRLTIWAIAAGCLAAPAQAMTVAEFLGKVDRLKARGVLALGSSDIGLLKREMEGVTKAYRADVDGASAAGRPPHSCPPPRGQAKMTSSDLLAEFQKIPPAQRGMSVKAAFYAMMKRRYPCPA